jgi:hypothetical protein
LVILCSSNFEFHFPILIIVGTEAYLYGKRAACVAGHVNIPTTEQSSNKNN